MHYKQMNALSSLVTCHRISNNCKATGVTIGVGTFYHSGAHEFTTGF